MKEKIVYETEPEENDSGEERNKQLMQCDDYNSKI